jgi:hypothetical protein
MTKGGRSQIVTIRERLSDRLLKLLEHVTVKKTARSRDMSAVIVSASKPDELNLVQSDQEIACTL